MRDVCQECGDTKPLNEDGVCRHRGGCEHRQFQHRARIERLQEEMDHAEHCPIHGTNSIYGQAQQFEPWQNTWGETWGQPSMYEQFIQGIIMGGPIFGTAWYESMDQKILGNDNEENDNDS